MSADPQTLKAMVSGIRRMERILGVPKMRLREIEAAAVAYRRQSA
jgi:sialic acid synthase SpsE